MKKRVYTIFLFLNRPPLQDAYDTATLNGLTSNRNEANGLKIESVNTLTFNNNLIINANNNDISGISISSKSTAILFEGPVTTSTNDSSGIFISGSTATFKGAVTSTTNGFGQEEGNGDGPPEIPGFAPLLLALPPVLENNGDHGIKIQDSTATFTSNVHVSKNAGVGISIEESIIEFNTVISSDNQGSGILILNSEGTFKGALTLNGNKDTGLQLNNSPIIFESTVSASDTIGEATGISLVNSSPTFKANVNTNNNFGAGLVIRQGSSPTFDGAVTATNNKRGIYIEGSTPTFNGNVTAQGMHLKGDSSVTFGDGIVLSSPITTENHLAGKAVFNGNVTINNPISDKAALSEVRFKGTPDKIANVNANITAGEIYFSKMKIKIADGVLLNSSLNNTIHLLDSTLDLGLGALKVSGTVANDNEGGDITINTTFDANKIGHIELQGAGDTLDFTNSKSLILNATNAPLTPLPVAGETRNYNLIETNGGTFTLKNEFTLNIPAAWSKFVDSSFAPGTAILSQTRKPDPVVILNDVVNDQANNIEVIAQDPVLLEDIINIAANEGQAAAQEAVERLTNPDAVAIATAPVNLGIQDATQAVSNRAENVSAPLQTFSFASNDSNSYISGTSAGDEIYKYGAWISPFYGVSTQGSRGGIPGYKSKYYGAVLGFDAMINDETALGVALSAIKTEIKHRHQNSGDKTTANTYIFSGYGTYEITKEWFVQGVGSIGRSKIKNREIRREFTRNSFANASYNATSWGVEALTGYNKEIRKGLMVTPLFGLEFNRLNGINYTETGTVNQNLAVTRKAVNQLEAILGARITGRYIFENNLEVLPELHGNARYNVLNKKLNIDVVQDGGNGESLTPRSDKPIRMVYNIGCGISAKYDDKWEYSAGYDVRLANSYVSHQGSLKLKMNF